MSVSSPEDEARFARWLAEHAAIPQRLSLAYAAGSDDGADLRQEMLVQLWRSLPRFRGQARESTWIYRVCLNTALAWQRDRRRREARVTNPGDALPEPAAAEAGPAEAHERREQLAALTAAVRGLPPTDRSLVVLALDGLSHREIGEITGLTENHVGVALLRARRKLAAAMKGVSDEL